MLLESSNRFDWALQPSLAVEQNGQEVDYNIWCSAVKAKKKQIVSFMKLEQTQRIRREGLEKVAYDPKRIEKFGGIVQ